MKKLKVILIGAGGRGNMYTSKMTEDKYEVIAVADPNPDCIKRVKETHIIGNVVSFLHYFTTALYRLCNSNDFKFVGILFDYL